MPKKYRLLKDVENPGFRVARGAILEERGEHYQWDSWYVLAKHYVEENKVWFEEIKEKERTKVLSVTYTDTDEYDAREAWLKITLSKHTPSDRIKPIREAIESILNDEPIEEQKTWMFESEFKFGTELNEKITFPLYVNGVEFVPKPTDNQPLSGELITKEVCERREYNAFYAARRGLTDTAFESFKLFENKATYPKFWDYKESTK